MPNPGDVPTHPSAQSRLNTVRKRAVFRKKAPSTDKWDGVRLLVKRYYIDEGKTLREVSELLSKEHGFDVPPHMLKLRLKQWLIKKNFKKKEHEAAAKAARCAAETGLNIPDGLNTDGRPYAWRQVTRHFASDPQYMCSWLRSDADYKTAISRHFLRASPVDHRIEVMLTEIKYHWSHTLTLDETRNSVRTKRRIANLKSDPKEIHIKLLGSLLLFRHGQEAQCWWEINSTCSKLPDLFKLEEPDLLKEMMLIFTARAWVRHPEMFLKVVRYLRDLCSGMRSLGPCHPLTNILESFGRLAQSMEIFDDLVEHALKVMVDVAERAGDKVKLDRDYIFTVEHSYISKVCDRLEWHEAKDLVEDKFSYYRRTLGERNHQTLYLQSDLARLYVEQASRARSAGEKTQAEMCERAGEEIDLKLVKMAEKDPYDRNRNGMYINAAENLGKLYFARQEFQKAQDYYCKALTWAAGKFGDNHPYISLLLRQFRALQKLGELGLVKVKLESELEEEYIDTQTSREQQQPDDEAYPALDSQDNGSSNKDDFFGLDGYDDPSLWWQELPISTVVENVQATIFDDNTSGGSGHNLSDTYPQDPDEYAGDREEQEWFIDPSSMVAAPAYNSSKKLGTAMMLDSLDGSAEADLLSFFGEEPF